MIINDRGITLILSKSEVTDGKPQRLFKKKKKKGTLNGTNFTACYNCGSKVCLELAGGQIFGPWACFDTCNRNSR